MNSLIVLAMANKILTHTMVNGVVVSQYPSLKVKPNC